MPSELIDQPAEVESSRNYPVPSRLCNRRWCARRSTRRFGKPLPPPLVLTWPKIDKPYTFLLCNRLK
jgi:hypothetical protein